tara:strand:- start:2512 stop:4176 length:1665 start_codon:yes stop_codon:yes gene_type:complete
MEDTTQRASQIGSGLTSRFRSQLSSFDNYSRNRNLTMQGTADAYRQNLIAQAGKTDSGKLMNEMIQGQITSEGGASALALSQLGLKGAKSFYGRRLARQQAEVEDARGDVDRAFPEEEEGGDVGEETGEASVSQTTPAVSQGVSSDLPSAAAEDFSGASSGISGVSESGAIQVPSSYTQGVDPATAPSTSVSAEPSAEPSLGASAGESDITSQLPVEGLGGSAPAGLQPPPPSLYTNPEQTGLSEAGYYASRESQLPQRVMFDNTQDPPLSDIMDRMQRGDLTLGDSPAEAVSQEQAGQRLSNLLDTTAEQQDTTSLAYGGAAEQEAIQSGAQSIDIGAGARAITQTELAKPTPTVEQPAAPRPTEPVGEDSPFNPEGGVTESSSGTDAVIDANTHRSLTQAAENPNADATTTSATQNVDQVKANISGSDEAGSGISSDVTATEGGMSAEQTAAATGLETGLEGVAETGGIMAGIETASSVLGVLAPLGMLAGLIYEGVSAQKEHDEEQKKMDEASAQEQGEINVEDNESQFTAGRPAFGSMSLAPNLDLKTSS